MPPEKDHEDDLKRFEAHLASLIPRRDRIEPGWGELLAEKAARRDSPAAIPCAGPSGHVFVCLYCGREAEPSTGAGRFAWPASLAAISAVAAVLFVMLLVQHGPQRAEHPVASDANSPVAPTLATSTPTALPDNAIAEHSGDGDPRGLATTEAGLVEAFCSRGDALAFNAAASVDHPFLSKSRLSSLELIERLVRDPKAADDPLGYLFSDPSTSTRSEL